MLSITFEDEILTLVGTPGNDTIYVHIEYSGAGSDAVVAVNMDFRNLLSPSRPGLPPGGRLLERIIIDGRGGNDAIEVTVTLWEAPISIDAGKGHDRVSIENYGSAATVFGGDGNDMLKLFGRGQPEGILMDGGGGHDRITIEAQDGSGDVGVAGSTVRGGDGNDWIRTDNTADFLDGGAGNDVLIGSGGDDVIRGGAGNDRLIGGPGRDRLVGGPGKDEFFQSSVKASARKTRTWR